MGEILRKKYVAAQVFHVFVIFLLVAFVGVALLYLFGDSTVWTIPLLIAMAIVWIFGDLYTNHCRSLVTSYQALKKQGRLGLLDALDSKKPELIRSGVWCDMSVMVFKKPWVVIVFDQIGWAHLVTKRTIFGKKNYVMIHTRCGKSYTVRPDLAEFQWLLDKWIMPLAPEAVFGYDAEREARFYANHPEAAEHKQRQQRTSGLVLVGISLCLLVLGAIAGKNVTIWVVATMLPGLMALLSGKKKEA